MFVQVCGGHIHQKLVGRKRVGQALNLPTDYGPRPLVELHCATVTKENGWSRTVMIVPLTGTIYTTWKVQCTEGSWSGHHHSVSWHIAVILSWWSWGSSCCLEETGRPIWEKRCGQQGWICTTNCTCWDSRTETQLRSTSKLWPNSLTYSQLLEKWFQWRIE